MSEQRACPACGRGDHGNCTGWAWRSRYTPCPCAVKAHVNDAEIQAGMNGLPLPDVGVECGCES